jgi:hypothetical protein
MKQLLIFSLFIGLVISCNQPQESKIDSNLIDSINKADSIKLAFENRPWRTDTFVDDFGDKTGNIYIYTKVLGTFSNSATSNSAVFVKIIITKNIAGLFLHQYSPDNPAEKFIGQGKISMKNQAGTLKGISSIGEWNKQGGLLIENTAGFWNYYSDLVNFIKASEGEIKFVVVDSYSSKFNFSINANGFVEEYKKLRQ